MSTEIKKLEPDACPTCGYVVDTHAPTDEEEVAPKPNDLSVCPRCAGWNRFDENLKLTVLTEEDIKQCDEEILAELNRLRELILAHRRTLN